MRDQFAYEIDYLAENGPHGRTTLYKVVKGGQLKAKKLGRRTIILRQDYLDWLQSLPDRLPSSDINESERCDLRKTDALDERKVETPDSANHGRTRRQSQRLATNDEKDKGRRRRGGSDG